MSKTGYIQLKMLIVSLFFVLLSGCSSAPSVTFEQMAKWQDDVFVSEFGGFSVEIPQNWSSLSDSEIEAQVEGMENVIYGTPSVSLEQFQKSDGLYPMILVTEIQSDSDAQSYASAFIIFERLGTLAKMSVKTADKYLEILKEGYLAEDTEGLAYDFGEIYSKNIGGIEYRCLPISVELYQVQQLFAVRIKDDFVIGLIFTASDNHPQLLEEALSAFSVFP
jgi:hypothetical protein